MKYLAISTILSTLLQTPTATAAALSPAGGPDSPSSPIHAVPTNYTDAEGTLLQGFLALPGHHGTPSSGTGEKNKVPAVIILHDRDGPTTYEKQRAAIFPHSHNYAGFAADIYGFDVVKPVEDFALLSKFTGNATLFGLRIQAAIDYVQNLEEVDETKVAIVGYCMGGTGVVHYLNTHGNNKDGRVPLAGAVGIHPSLLEWPGPLVDIDIPSLFLTGGADFLTSPATMKKLETDMQTGTANSVEGKSPPWETVRYAKIGHAFSNWGSEGSYDERVDARSFHSQMMFLEEEFGVRDFATDDPAPEAKVTQVDYMDGDSPLIGYVSKPESMMVEGSDDTKLPVVIILPHTMDSSGSDEYEKQRATQLATDSGFIGFVADIYSSDVEDTATSNDLEEMYHGNVTKYLSRIRAAVDHVKTMDGVHLDKIALLGFGFGGSGALYYAMSDYVDGFEGGVDSSVKAIASFHGELGKVVNATTAGGVISVPAPAASGGGDWGSGSGGSDSESWGAESNTGSSESSWGGEVATGSEGDSDGSPSNFTRNGGTTRRSLEDGHTAASNKPQILIQSGFYSDDMDDVIALEQALINMDANYELTRFSDTHEHFTLWNDVQGRYNPRATARSFDQLGTVLNEVFDATPPPSPAATSMLDGDASMLVGDASMLVGDNNDHAEDGHGHGHPSPATPTTPVPAPPSDDGTPETPTVAGAPSPTPADPVTKSSASTAAVAASSSVIGLMFVPTLFMGTTLLL